MSSIVDKVKDKLSIGDDKSGNPQAGGAVTDPRGHDASKLPFSTKQGQNEQDFPGEVRQADLTWTAFRDLEMPCFWAGSDVPVKSFPALPVALDYFRDIFAVYLTGRWPRK